MGRSRLQVFKVSLCILLVFALLAYFYTTFLSARDGPASIGRQAVELLPTRWASSMKEPEEGNFPSSDTSLLLDQGGDTPIEDALDVAMVFTKANGSLTLKRKFETCISSMLEFASRDINLHVIGDYHSLILAKEIVSEERKANDTAVEIRVLMYDANDVARQTEPLVRAIKRHFIYKPGAYYSDSLFFFSIAMHHVLTRLDRVLMLDVDLRFRADVAQLYAHFDQFETGQVIGLAREQQPVYRHVFHLYRRDNPGTAVGDPPPDGLTGFNSAVLLLHLSRMRESLDYSMVLNASSVASLVDKYRFQGHLGDQDVFTLISLDRADLFYVLPCFWNRQLCQWWRYHGYEDVFDLYHACDAGEVRILHGNCNTPIPED